MDNKFPGKDVSEEDIKTKSSDGTRYYKLKWRYDYGTHGMPF